MKYGERLRFAREHKKLSQQELAEKSGVGQGSISKIERGDQKVSSHDIELSYALDIHPFWLKNEDKAFAPPWLPNDNKDYIEGEVISHTDIIQPPANYIIEAKTLPFISWHNISKEINSEIKNMELKPIPTDKVTVSDTAFMVEIDHNRYEPYLMQSDVAIVDPEIKPTSGNRVIVVIDDAPHVMRYERIDKEYLYPEQPGSTAIPITEDLNYKIIGVLVWIVPAGRQA